MARVKCLVGRRCRTTPMVATWLIQRTHDDLSPAFYLMGAASISLIAILCLPETSRLAEPEPPEIVGLMRFAAWPSGPVTADTFAMLIDGMVDAPKSPCGFRAAYAERAAQIFVVRAPGCAPADFWMYPFQRIPRPLWPWDEIELRL